MVAITYTATHPQPAATAGSWPWLRMQCAPVDNPWVARPICRRQVSSHRHGRASLTGWPGGPWSRRPKDARKRRSRRPRPASRCGPGRWVRSSFTNSRRTLHLRHFFASALIAGSASVKQGPGGPRPRKRNDHAADPRAPVARRRRPHPVRHGRHIGRLADRVRTRRRLLRAPPQVRGLAMDPRPAWSPRRSCRSRRSCRAASAPRRRPASPSRRRRRPAWWPR